MRKIAPQAIEHSSNPMETKTELESMVTVFDCWSSCLSGGSLSSLWRHTARYRYTSKIIVECVRLSRFLRGGPDSLAEVIERAVNLISPIGGLMPPMKDLAIALPDI